MTSIILLWNQLVLIFLGPFWTIVPVVLYHKLVKAKQSAGAMPIQAIKKPNGCLAALGLSIAFIVLSIFWSTGLVGIFKSDTGARFWEAIKKPIKQQFFSPEIVFPNNVTFKRPDEWWAFQAMQEGKPRYEFFRHTEHKLNSFQLWSLPLTRNDGSRVKDSEIANWILDETFNKITGFHKQLYGNLKPKSAEQVSINGDMWGAFELRGDTPGKAGDVTLYAYFYKPFQDYVLIFSYGHHYKFLTELEPKYESDKSEMMEIIKQMKP